MYRTETYSTEEKKKKGGGGLEMLIPTCIIDMPFDFCTLIIVDATVTMCSKGCHRPLLLAIANLVIIFILPHILSMLFLGIDHTHVD